MYETFEHTADLGIRARAGDLETLFAEAALGLFSAAVDNLEAVRPLERFEVRLARPADLEYLLFDWLNALLYRYDVDHLLFGGFSVTFAEDAFLGVAVGEPLDRARHVLTHEIKAITYHGLKVERTPDGWLAEAIVDI